MKCIILAAGFATRLYPLIKNKPKQLLPISGKPIIEHIIEKIDKYIDEIYIVSNNKFFNNFNEWLNNYKSSVKINLVNDNVNSNEERLGGVGDLKFVLDKSNINEDTMILAGDNLFNFDVKDIIEFFKNNGTCIGLYDVKDKELAKHYGVTIIEGSIIKDFQEKPNNPKSTLVSTAIYLITKKDLEELDRFYETGDLENIGHFIHHLSKIKEIYGFKIKGSWYDIGTIEEYEKAERENIFKNKIIFFSLFFYFYD
ncbi:MAG: nucleotidyltransferase family protein [Candidatus Nanoarchaeia archaeon]|jgi:glucose-1-phosphate thymidylyltransferase|nr:nucleotidyltransferase family protein [Candidatus Nanoarchaeia archaeon]|tara:strand:- start:5189 stop:5953 length:765 start_codon:yes stop_codon:yes gene_type:complete